MNLTTEIFGGVIVVHTPEEVANEQASEISVALCQLERRNLVVDLDATETIDSKGLTALVEAQDSLRGLGGELKLATTNLQNRKILEITRLDQRFEVFESVVDAVRSYQ
ncbi:MAG: STAS domain-containing protein [Planctomycetes bacterium]|nr:STAS domain-containing protein [Planctomycetota bacterium]